MCNCGPPSIKSLGDSYTGSVYAALYKLRRISYGQIMEWKPREQAGNDVIIRSFVQEKYYKSAASTDKADGRIPDLPGWINKEFIIQLTGTVSR